MNGFDRIARPYRWLEYLTFGTALQNTRTALLTGLKTCNKVLVLGDGDGRFSAALLHAYSHIHIHAVDASAAMLQLLVERCGSTRVTVEQCDVNTFQPMENYDAVVTHFLLDCLSTQQIENLAQRMATIAPLWLVSEFDVPSGPLASPARLLINGLYLCFRIVTGLRTQHLPAWRKALHNAGFEDSVKTKRLGGILVSELKRLRFPDA